MKRSAIFAIFLITVATILSGCSSPESKLPGKWVEKGAEKSGEYLEFFSDNTVTMTTPAVTFSGTWSILDDGRVKADLSALFVKITLLGELEGKTLVLDVEGKKVSFLKS